MITNPEVAKQISETMKQMWEELCGCCELVRDSCSPEEYAAFIKATRNVGCGIVMDVMEPLYEANPSLKPSGWDDGLERGSELCRTKP
jgi:hypothetical protein